MKLFFWKFYCNILQIADRKTPILERAESFGKTAGVFSPLAFIVSALSDWYWDNQGFTLTVIVMVFINMILGGVMHFKKGDFKWESLLMKTVVMIFVITVVYLTLELIIAHAGDGVIVQAFRSAMQVATLLYPGSKILKQTFILSHGEHPPKWIMNKVYNFQQNGDLREFLDSNNATPERNENID